MYFSSECACVYLRIMNEIRKTVTRQRRTKLFKSHEQLCSTPFYNLEVLSENYDWRVTQKVSVISFQWLKLTTRRASVEAPLIKNFRISGHKLIAALYCEGGSGHWRASRQTNCISLGFKWIWTLCSLTTSCWCALPTILCQKANQWIDTKSTDSQSAF